MGRGRGELQVSIKDKKIIVTGARGDIGSVVAAHLEAHGAAVFCGTHDSCDVTDPDSVRMFFADAVNIFDGRLDGLVTCHGAPGCIKPTLDLTDEEFLNVIQVDLVGTLRVCREAARYMLPQGSGRIVCLSSIHAIATYPKRAAYAAAKAGVVGLAKALAVEWAKDGIAVNAVLPGQVARTRRTDRLDVVEVLERSPSISLPLPEEVAEAVAFLLQTSGINGHALTVDDGWLASAWYKNHENA